MIIEALSRLGREATLTGDEPVDEVEYLQRAISTNLPTWPEVQNAIAEIKSEQLTEEIKGECRKRIYAIASETDQMNMAALASAGMFNPVQLTAFQSGLTWIAAMRSASTSLINVEDEGYTDDDKWPGVPTEVAALVASI